MSKKFGVRVIYRKVRYFAYFHSIMEFGIIFWGASVERKRIFLQQKRIIRIMTVSSTRNTCKKLFQKLKIRINLDVSVYTVFDVIPLIQSRYFHIQFFSAQHKYQIYVKVT
jgi:hypothetical protein